MPRLREQARRVDPNLVVSDMRTLNDQLNMRLANERISPFYPWGSRFWQPSSRWWVCTAFCHS